MAIKPLRHQESGVGNAAIDTQTQCAAPRPSRLLSIPFELRQRILFLVLPLSRPYDKYGSIWHLGDTSILRTCRQFHEEGTSVLYSSNTFTINVKGGGHCPAVPSVSSGRDSARRKGLLMWFYHHRFGGSVAFRHFHEPFPMRPGDIWLIRRWKIYIAEIDDYRGYDSHDAFKMTLLLQDRVRDLVNHMLQGRQHLKILRAKWQGGSQTAVDLEQYRKTILKPLQEKAMAVEQEFYVWRQEEIMAYRK